MHTNTHREEEKKESRCGNGKERDGRKERESVCVCLSTVACVCPCVCVCASLYLCLCVCVREGECVCEWHTMRWRRKQGNQRACSRRVHSVHVQVHCRSFQAVACPADGVGKATEKDRAQGPRHLFRQQGQEDLALCACTCASLVACWKKRKENAQTDDRERRRGGSRCEGVRHRNHLQRVFPRHNRGVQCPDATKKKSETSTRGGGKLLAVSCGWSECFTQKKKKKKKQQTRPPRSWPRDWDTRETLA